MSELCRERPSQTTQTSVASLENHLNSGERGITSNDNIFGNREETSMMMVNSDDHVVDQSTSFGPWMLVQAKNRRKPNTGLDKKVDNNRAKNPTNRFQILTNNKSSNNYVEKGKRKLRREDNLTGSVGTNPQRGPVNSNHPSSSYTKVSFTNTVSFKQVQTGADKSNQQVSRSAATYVWTEKP